MRCSSRSNPIQVATAEERFVDHFRKLSNTRREAAVKDSVFTQLVQSIYENAVQLGTGLILLVAANAMQPNQPPALYRWRFCAVCVLPHLRLGYDRVLWARHFHVSPNACGVQTHGWAFAGRPAPTLVAHNPIGLKPSDMFAKNTTVRPIQPV